MSAFLTAPYETKRILDKYGIRAKKKYGQNFLINGSVVRGIVEAAGVTKEDCVLEIGPGIGTMTQELSLAAGQVVAVEIDTTLEPVLAETLDACTNVTILWQDILKTDVRAIRDTYNGGRRLKCVANLPYYITTPILLQLLREKDSFESITVMVQKEVAERILATEKDKEYGALSLAALCPDPGLLQPEAEDPGKRPLSWLLPERADALPGAGHRRALLPWSLP